MVDVEVRTPISPTDVTTMRQLAEAVTHDDHRVTMDEEDWAELATPSSRAAIVFAVETTGPIAAAYVAPSEGTERERFNVELILQPGAVEVASLLLDGAARHVRVMGGNHLQLWIPGNETMLEATALEDGFEQTRQLWQMRVPLPLHQEPAWPTSVSVRRFVPGQDEEIWLAANNRAFVADPDQGGWTHDELDRRQREPWFDPAGFLLAFDDRGLAGFCWTKIHPPQPPAEPVALGELYVIGVDPDRQRQGLGRALAVGGLASLHQRGTTVGMLYVDAGNTAAVALYRRLGFEVTRIDRAYTRSVA